MTTVDWAEAVAGALVGAGVEVVAYVPDAALARILAHLPEGVTRILLGREEEGVGVLAGSFLGGRFGALLTQNTGLGNSVNALASYAVPAGIPLLLVISHRGDLHEFNPAQLPMGRASHAILDSLGIAHRDLTDVATVPATVLGAAQVCRTMRRPVGLFLRTALTGGKVG